VQIELEQPTIELLERAASVMQVHSFDEVIVKAVSDTLQHRRLEGSSPEQIVERFRKYRGMLSGVSLADLVESRHKGLP
jgi:hypothetical protein